MMPWREALVYDGLRLDFIVAGGGTAAGSIFAAFDDMTGAALALFVGVALIVFGRAALTWIRVCKEWRHRDEPPKN